MAKRHGGATRTQVIEHGIPEPPEVPPMDKESATAALEIKRGTAFDWTASGNVWGELFDDPTLVVAPSERRWVTEVQEMLKRGGQPASVEQALALPIRQANLTIEKPEGDKGQAEHVREVLFSSGSQGGMRPDIAMIVAQLTWAISVKRTFHELVFERRPDGKIGYKSVAWRPPSTCEPIRSRRGGALHGFRQYVDAEAYGWSWGQERPVKSRWSEHEIGKYNHEELGFVRVPANRAVMHFNGQHRDPVNGISDLEVTHWAWQLQQKILFMWATFLDGQAMPKVIAYGDSDTDAKANATAIATLRGSGVLGLKRDVSRPDMPVFETLDSSGKGAAQFAEMIRYLEQQMSHSVLAGFLDLTSNASEGIGSYALSADQKGLFLTSRQAAAREIAATVTDQIIAPLVRINFGASAGIPRLVFEKMSEDQSDKAMQMLQQIGSATNINVPSGFVDLLVERVAQYLELSDEKVETMLAQGIKEREEKKALAEESAKAAGQPQSPNAVKAGTPNSKLTSTVNTAMDAVKQHRQEKQ